VNESDLRNLHHAADQVERWATRSQATKLAAYEQSAQMSAAFSAAVRPVLDAVEHVGRVVRTATSFAANFDQIARIVADTYRRYQEALPPNWPTDTDIIEMIELANDGIPVAWVPPAEVLTALLAAEDRPGRFRVLDEHRGTITAAVRLVLDEVTHPEIKRYVPLARRAVDAWDDGHLEAAQALSVAVAETVITEFHAEGRKYAVVRKAALIDLEDPDGEVTLGALRYVVAIAPIASFYTPWWPSSGLPKPDLLSRHVTVHHADASHYTSDNAMIAVLLQVSVLRAVQQLLSDRDASATIDERGV
jgi:hypothetical protein